MTVAGSDVGGRRVLVAGIGNIFLSDDGFGSEVVRRLGRERLPDGIRAVDYGIGGIHLAYDLLEGYDQLVMVDAIPTGGEPGSLRVLEIGESDVGSAALDAHAMDPAAVLANLRRLGGTMPPTLLVGCQPASVEEGIGLSPAVEAAIETALSLVRDLAVEAVEAVEATGETMAATRATEG